MPLVDLENDNFDVTALEKDLTEAIHSQQQSAKLQSSQKGEASRKAEEQDSSDSAHIPDKLRNKSVEEIAEMYRNLESAYGRMANDLGSQRKLTDQLLELKRSEDLRSNGQTVPKPEVNSTELLDDPTSALDKYFEARLAQLQAQSNEKLSSIESKLGAAEFARKHGDVSVYGNDPDFIQFINATQYRMNRASQAANGDYEAADELLSEFKDLQSRRNPKPTKETIEEVHDPEVTSHLEAARKAGLENSGNSGSKPSGKVYSRAALMRLRLEKPDMYYDDAFQAEITRAYEEGRVK